MSVLTIDLEQLPRLVLYVQGGLVGQPDPATGALLAPGSGALVGTPPPAGPVATSSPTGSLT